MLDAFDEKLPFVIEEKGESVHPGVVFPSLLVRAGADEYCECAECGLYPFPLKTKPDVFCPVCEVY